MSPGEDGLWSIRVSLCHSMKMNQPKTRSWSEAEKTPAKEADDSFPRLTPSPHWLCEPGLSPFKFQADHRRPGFYYWWWKKSQPVLLSTDNRLNRNCKGSEFVCLSSSSTFLGLRPEKSLFLPGVPVFNVTVYWKGTIAIYGLLDLYQNTTLPIQCVLGTCSILNCFVWENILNRSVGAHI